MKDFTVQYPFFRNVNLDLQKECDEDNFSDKSIDEETIPDEEFNKNKKSRDKLLSCPIVDHKGPNINLKIQHKRYSNQKEKEFFFAKKKLNYVKIMKCIMTAIIKMNVVLHMELKN